MPSDPVLGGSEEKQAKFLSDVLEYWDAAGIQVRFLSWWQLHDYLYDDTLQVQLSKTNDVQVVQSENPPEANYYGEPVGAFWGTGNSLPYFFFGPKKDPQSAGDPTNLDLVYYLNQSAKGGAYEFFCRWLSSCGLRRADGSPKLAWSVYRDWTEARRKQT
jgi:hypothetical protein